MDSRTTADRTSLLRQSTVQILKAYTRKQRSPMAGYPAFAEYAERYVERYRSQYRQLEAFGPDVRKTLRATLADLAQAGQCRLHVTGDEIESIEFPLFYSDAVREAYRRTETTPEAPFPSEADLGITIPNDLISTANVASDLAGLLKGGDTATPLTRLLFPESLHSTVVPSDLIRSGLLDVALAKIKYYLSQATNASYVQSRLAAAYRGNQALVSDMISNIAMRGANARETIENASDAHFRFWAQLTHLIVQENRPGAEGAYESGPRQAAHIVNAYVIALRNAGQDKQNEVRAALKTVEAHFAKEPFVYTFKELLGLKDADGRAVVNKGGQDAFLEFLKEKMRPPAGKIVPELMRLKSADGAEHFVHRDRLLPVFLRMKVRVAEDADSAIAQGWERALREGQKLGSMSSDDLFAAEVQRTVTTAHPLFQRLLDEGLLNSVQREAKLPPAQALELSRCFDHRGEKLKPLFEILALDRKSLLARVRAAVPLWAQVAFLRAIVLFFRRLFSAAARGAAQSASGRASSTLAAAAPATTVKRMVGPAEKEEPRAKGATLKQRNAAVRRDLERLRDHFAGPDATLATPLAELAEKWNPLVEPRARADLKEDVDSMVRTFLRGILRRGGSMKPPDVNRIISLSQRLAANPAFDRVHRKDLFVRYVQLMMIRVLGDQHGVKL